MPESDAARGDKRPFNDAIDPLLPLEGWGNRRSRISPTGSKRPFEGLDECVPARSDAPLARVLIRTRK